MTTSTLTYTGTLTITSCWCGIHMAIPNDLYLEGQCPLCGHHLRDVERHINRMHPNETPEGDTNG